VPGREGFRDSTLNERRDLTFQRISEWMRRLGLETRPHVHEFGALADCQIATAPGGSGRLSDCPLPLSATVLRAARPGPRGPQGGSERAAVRSSLRLLPAAGNENGRWPEPPPLND